jgi:hypothetical protein
MCFIPNTPLKLKTFLPFQRCLEALNSIVTVYVLNQYIYRFKRLIIAGSSNLFLEL